MVSQLGLYHMIADDKESSWWSSVVDVTDLASV